MSPFNEKTRLAKTERLPIRSLFELREHNIKYTTKLNFLFKLRSKVQSPKSKVLSPKSKVQVQVQVHVVLG